MRGGELFLLILREEKRMGEERYFIRRSRKRERLKNAQREKEERGNGLSPLTLFPPLSFSSSSAYS